MIQVGLKEAGSAGNTPCGCGLTLKEF